MTDTRYFIFSHKAAFDSCRLEGLHWSNGAVCPDGNLSESVLVTPILDSGESGNVWQRVLADVTIGDGGRIIWQLFASDLRHAVDDGEPYFYGAIRPTTPSEKQHFCGAIRPTTPSENLYINENADDFLPIGVCGRYLKLEAVITGNVELRSLRIYQSWESFLDYLPEIYRDYNSFSDRFLRIFAAKHLDLESRIDRLPGMFDPAVAPPDTLRWLAGIAGVRHINLWETDGLRRLLVGGVYRRRGQFSVFADYIEYFTGYRPYIAEHFRYRTGIPENDLLYSDGDVTVFLPPEAAGLNLETLDVIIDDFLPEDIVCRVVVLDLYPVVSGGYFLGVNAHVGRYERTVVGTARVGVTVIGGVA